MMSRDIAPAGAARIGSMHTLRPPRPPPQWFASWRRAQQLSARRSATNSSTACPVPTPTTAPRSTLARRIGCRGVRRVARHRRPPRERATSPWAATPADRCACPPRSVGSTGSGRPMDGSIFPVRCPWRHRSMSPGGLQAGPESSDASARSFSIAHERRPRSRT